MANESLDAKKKKTEKYHRGFFYISYIIFFAKSILNSYAGKNSLGISEGVVLQEV